MAIRSLSLKFKVNLKLSSFTQVPCKTISSETSCVFRKYQHKLRLIDNQFVCIRKCAPFHTGVKLEEAANNSVSVPSEEKTKNVSDEIVTEDVKGLLEFFDDEKNWGEQNVKSGRSWTTDELRIKSNSDLHKLWFVLLKERNMLLTMDEAAKRECELMPNPERLDKVEESMENLEQVVKERNRAYHLLETGETGERKVKIVRDGLGLYRRYAEIEHTIPEFMNNSFRKKYYFNGHGAAVNKFLARMREKHERLKLHAERVQRHNARKLLERFPDLEDDVLQEKFPDVDLKKLRYTMS